MLSLVFILLLFTIVETLGGRPIARYRGTRSRTIAPRCTRIVTRIATSLKSGIVGVVVGVAVSIAAIAIHIGCVAVSVVALICEHRKFRVVFILFIVGVEEDEANEDRTNLVNVDILHQQALFCP